MSHKLRQRILLSLGILSWILILITDLLFTFGNVHKISFGIPLWIHHGAVTMFFISSMLFFRNNFEVQENFNVVNFLWKVFVMGLSGVFISRVLLDGISWSLDGTRLMNDPLVHHLIYNINFGLFCLLLFPSYYVFKKFVLYQKTKIRLYFWNAFSLLLSVALIFNFIPIPGGRVVLLIILALVVGYIFLVSTNLKWIAYLNYKQKWKSIFLFLLILICTASFSFYFLNESVHPNLIFNIIENRFLFLLVLFLGMYSGISILVLFFNLPTSSVFEQKIEDVKGFQKMSQIINMGQNEQEVYKVLLESATKGSLADAAWLELHNINGEQQFIHHEMLHEGIIPKIRDILISFKQEGMDGIAYIKKLNLLKDYKKTGLSYRSALIFKLTAHNEELGMLYLLKDINSGFEKEIIDLIGTFVNQASISIDNLRLIKDSIEFGIYKEELNIARRVQHNLLPKDLPTHPKLDIKAFSQSSDQVGGDYYDVYKLDGNNYSVTIGDISGKGTSAAFNTAQMKGVFQALVQLDLKPAELMRLANNAMAICLDKSSFVTLSIFKIDVVEQGIEYARAGHCPALFYSKKENACMWLKPKGLGLGIVRNNKFQNYIEDAFIKYDKGDILLLYTDGIPETFNYKGKLYGYERVQQNLQSWNLENAHEIQKKMIEDLYASCGSGNVKDDYTLVIIKFG